jgi:hypothetical protein
MPGLSDSIPADLDHAPVTEALRRLLYDAAAQLAFVPDPKANGPEELPGYSPDDGGFTVFHVWGRWFAVWFDLDSNETDLPLAVRWQVVRLKSDSSRPEGIIFQEV